MRNPDQTYIIGSKVLEIPFGKFRLQTSQRPFEASGVRYEAYINTNQYSHPNNLDMIPLEPLPLFITLDVDQSRLLVQTEEEGSVGNYSVVLAKVMNGECLFASFNLHVIIDPSLFNGYLQFEPPLQLNHTIL